MPVSATEIVNELGIQIKSTKTITFHSSEGTNFRVSCGSFRNPYEPYVSVPRSKDRTYKTYKVKGNCEEVRNHLNSFEQEPDANLDFSYDEHSRVLKKIRIY